MKQALIVFVKNIEPGKVKTRLAQSVGDEKATKVYQWLIEYTQSVAQETSADVFVFYNGVCMKPTTDYGISGATLTFTFTPVNNSQIMARYFV